ncbi:DUF2784 domain-containing protein [Cognatilysobacter bugurensis]|uniref:DUF2784 domain-containing protein n=1 Tax=Cognatilysobacter bugurensis TaxID=543356 RepID=A0A918SYI7_9GAMM|nr:DUF2784 domain-containing protein [Lysobacter bugurensis]GHA79342.1 hypothetical protein GCM10007067_16040 [Lysobacter bugurensis]
MLNTLAPAHAAALADAILVLHVGIVAFVVLGALAIALGARRWRWVRDWRWRTAHVLLMGFIALQAWLGALCPLTIWEQALREHAGQAAYGGSFIEHWLSRLIFFEAPAWVFVAAYTAFGALVIAGWFVVPPGRDRARPH